MGLSVRVENNMAYLKLLGFIKVNINKFNNNQIYLSDSGIKY